jgi:hypothetical protein
MSLKTCNDLRRFRTRSMAAWGRAILCMRLSSSLPA